MKPAAPFALLALLAAGCPDSDPPATVNPPQLWLALMGAETRVHLVAYESEPF